jgi:REase_MTES_1575
MEWRDVLREVVALNGGLATRRQLLDVVPKSVLDRHVNGNLVRVVPHVYRWRDDLVDNAMLARAALLHAGSQAALSHTTALAVWGLRDFTLPMHVTVDQSVRRSGSADVVAHRRLHFAPTSPQCVERHGLIVTGIPRSLVDSWPLLPQEERRPFVVEVARRRLTTATGLQDALDERPNVAGHRLLAQTIDLIADGCQSELEVLGVLNVFRHASLPRSVGQYKFRAGGVFFDLDRAWPEAKLAVELDGARHHTSPEDRERDLARDAALAAAGWIVLRFTYAEVRRNPGRVRARVLEVYRMRMSQLAAS